MQSLFGHDFSQVRVHADAQAAELQSGQRACLHRRAGRRFRAGTLRAADEHGKRLLAHELTHVMQQRASRQTISALSGQAAMQSARALMREPTPVPPPSSGPREETPLETHQKYLKNILPPAVNKIGSVQTPYSEALHALYAAGLLKAQSSPLVPKPGDPAIYPEVPIEVTVGSMKKKIMFRLSVYQEPSTVKRETRLGDKAMIVLDGSLPPVRATRTWPKSTETMVHEGMHVLSDLVTRRMRAPRPAALQTPRISICPALFSAPGHQEGVLPVIIGASSTSRMASPDTPTSSTRYGRRTRLSRS